MPTPISARCLKAWHRFDIENAKDPNTVTWEGTPLPRELFFSQRLSEWVVRLAPDGSEPLRLASRCQHLCRWMIPRADYEPSRAGYLKWRTDLKRFHATKTAGILHELGFEDDIIARVRSLNMKENLGKDPEVQVLEDGLCLLTLQYQLGELVEKTGPEKLVEILRKTWRKMSPAGHEHALKIKYAPEMKPILAAAVNGE